MLSIATVQATPSIYVASHDNEWKIEHPAAAYICLEAYPYAYSDRGVIPAALKESAEHGFNLAQRACELNLANLKGVSPVVLRALVQHNLQHQDPDYPFFHYLRGIGHFRLLNKMGQNMRRLKFALLRECVPLFKKLNNIVIFKQRTLTDFTWESRCMYQRYMLLCYLDCMLSAARLTIDGVETPEEEHFLTSTDKESLGVLPLIIEKTDWVNGFIGGKTNPMPLEKMVHYCYHCCLRGRGDSPLYKELLERLCQLCAGYANIENEFFATYRRPPAARPLEIDERPIAADKAKIERLLPVLFDFTNEVALNVEEIEHFDFTYHHEPFGYYHTKPKPWQLS